jgi:uncharacterized protein YqgV (UPF0045/DUF77 family)
MNIKDYVFVGVTNVILTFLFGLAKDWITNRVAKNKEALITVNTLQTELTAEKLTSAIAAAIKPLETKMDSFDSKIAAAIKPLETKMDSFDSKIAAAIKPLETKIDALDIKATNLSVQVDKMDTKVEKIGTKLTSVAEDVAFLKGKEEARRELATK